MHTPELDTSQADDSGVEPVVTRRGKVEEADMDITPMIDMTFLLLIFFMVSSRIAAKATVDLPKARHGDVIGMKDAVILTVAAGDPVPRVYAGDAIEEANLIAASTPEEQEDKIVAFVEEFARKENKRYVLVQASKGLKHRDVSRVAKAASKAELEQLFVGVMEKK
jgi:biopolymer transport protein ExbD